MLRSGKRNAKHGKKYRRNRKYVGGKGRMEEKVNGRDEKVQGFDRKYLGRKVQKGKYICEGEKIQT